jgi:uncharacterized protein HemY
LLGFLDQPDRAKYLKPPPPAPPPQEVIDAYEGLLKEARADPKQQAKLLGFGSLLSRFPMYVDACHQVRGGSRAAHVAAAYDRLLAIANAADPSLDAVKDSRLLGDNLEAFVDALIELGRASEVPALIARLEPHWQHNLGYGQLGAAAFKSGDWTTAERFFNQLRAGLADWERCEEMSRLAEIWCKTGRAQEARTLLKECLQRLLTKSVTLSRDTKKIYELRYQDHRAAYLRLFPDGAEELGECGIPETTREESI